jgi:hypothetical protein
MSISRTILIKSFVKPFYRQHAGLFVFLFTLMFGVVSVIDGAKFTDYHFFLIQGMMKNQFFFLLVLILWLLYAKKSDQFIISILRRPDYSFLNILSLLNRKYLYRLMIWIQFLLLLPLVLYACIIFVAGYYMHEYAKCLLVFIFIALLCIIGSARYLFIIYNPGRTVFSLTDKFLLTKQKKPYWSIFIRYIIMYKKLLFTGIKLYSCLVLYFMVKNQTGVAYDLRMILLFFSLGILGHGMLIHQLRKLEESRLRFYRSMPVSLLNRFAQYAYLFFILMIPEIITIVLLTPQYLHYNDALLFILVSYSIPLFLNSLLFVKFFRMIDYLKIIFFVFFTEYIAILAGMTVFLVLLFFLLATSIFKYCYYRFEK